VKPFFIYSALALALVFLGGAALAGVELLHEGNIFTDPKIKPALGFLVTGMMFLGIAVRGLRSRKRHESPHSEIPPRRQ
jgi:hypothetical protein